VQNNEFQQKQSLPRVKYHNSLGGSYADVSDPIKPSSSSHDKKRYRFSYAVKDGQSGDDFSHTQKQENGAVHGSYKVHLPDGRMQIVKYTADDIHGYRAEVSYEEDPAPAAVQQPKPFYPRAVKQVAINSIRHTVTPTPYLNGDFNIHAPSQRFFYPSTTVVPKHYY
jgi:Insect cuticle protein